MLPTIKIFLLISFCFIEHLFSMDAKLKARIDQSLKVAQEKGLSIVNEKKCPSDCVKKEGTSLLDFIGEQAAHNIEGKVQDLTKNERVIFISNNIPIDSLKQYVGYAQKNKVRLVIQGMIDGSMLKTAAFVEKIGYPVDIDPPLFKKYNVLKVPVFMQINEKNVVMIRGHITANFAFSKISKVFYS